MKDLYIYDLKSLLISVPCVDISEELVNYIQTYTRGQRLSKMWKDLHIGRLTSSIFGDVLSAGDNPKSLVKRIVKGSNLDRYVNMLCPTYRNSFYAPIIFSLSPLLRLSLDPFSDTRHAMHVK
jgi:hypothetical protein